MSFLQLRSYQNSPLNPRYYPVVTTQAVSNITSTSGDGNGTIVSSIGSAITARGFVYSTSNVNPTLADSVSVEGGTAIGTFTKTISSLSSATTYYVRAYATNAIGTGYGESVSFTTSAAAGGSIKTWDGLAWASVKTWNGLANASIKTFNGTAAQ